jgi:signal transduction histidine kinase
LNPNLPPLRRKIFGAYALLAALSAAALGGLFLAEGRIDDAVFQKVLTRNYDSIRAASRMRQAWDARPWTAADRGGFSAALRFAQGNITEPGEADIIAQLQTRWAPLAASADAPTAATDRAIRAALDRLVQVNEQGMQALAAQARRQNHLILLGLLAIVALTLGLALLIARRLARGLARPLIQMSEEIGRPRSFERALQLPEADSRELEVLRLRLQEWWEQARFKQRERLENEFIGVLSHELKTPLQSLGTAAELLDRKRDRMDPSLHPLLDLILEDLRRIRGVANDLVQVSQLNVRSVRLNLELVDLGAKVDEWMRPFRIQAEQRGVTLAYEGGSGGGQCRVDPVKFGWVVSNLLSNALRVSSFGQAVTVRVSDQKLYVELTVQDEGPGIAPALRERVFEPYFQGEGPQGERSAGLLGLGLTIAKEMVEAHEGAIEALGAPLQGSLFRVLLPLAARPKLEARP